MYYINGFRYDPVRQLLFRDAVPKDIVSKVVEAYDIKSGTDKPYDLQLNPDDMSMETIALNSAGLCLSFNCNLRCRYCGYASEENDTNLLHLEDVEIFIRDILKRRTIKKLYSKVDEPLELEITGGGEPTYDWPLFYDTILFIKKTCEENKIPVRIRLTTNGMISEEQADFIAANIDHTMISYDGLPDIQKGNRISPYEKTSADRVERTIRRLAASGASMTIRSTVWQDDYPKMADMYQHVYSLVQPRNDIIWSIYPVLFEGRAERRIKNQNDTTYHHFFNQCIELINIALRPDNKNHLQIDIPLLNNSVYPFFCGAHRAEKPWLLPDKSIVTCIESKEDKAYIGRIENGEIQYYQHYQDPLLKIAQKKYIDCQDCIAFSTCKGGCPIWHLRIDERIQEPLECGLQKEYWNYVIYALTTGKFSFGWKLEKLDYIDTSGWEFYKVVKEE